MNLQNLKELNKHSFNELIDAFNQCHFTLSDTHLAYLERLSLASLYATEQITREPIIFIEWLQSIDRNASFDVSQLTVDEHDFDENKIKNSLRKLRHYHLCHIILNDVCLMIDVEEILRQISDLAFKLIKIALNIASELLELKHGVPLNESGDVQHLMILSMGKLGGGELNFSSDIDLIFVYAEDGMLDGQGKLSYRELYTRVGRLFTTLLNDKTESGFVYRVDLRLRPWGDSGPIVINMNGLQNYYQLQGRDWERYALVKSKVITGNELDKLNLKQLIEPFVYRKYHDFNVFSGLGNLKQQIDHEARKKHQLLNIKLCSGGIREIEFCIQALQILQGGRHKQLQVSSILKMFDLAKNETFYTHAELAVLKKSYLLFRLVENRIQMLNDQQTHILPNDKESQARLLWSLNRSSWQGLMLDIESAQLQVNAIFKQLFIEHIQLEKIVDFAQYDEDDWLEYCENVSFKESLTIAKQLSLFFKERAIVSMTSKGRARLNELLPDFLRLISEQENPQKLLGLLTDLLLSIARRSVYLEMLSMHKPLLQKLINLFSISQWLAEEVIQFPILLESVLVSNSNDLFNKEYLYGLLNRELKQVQGDLELELDVLRVFKRQQLFYIAVQEIEGKIDPLKASIYLSELAEIMLQASFDLNLSVMLSQYGKPQYELNGKAYDAQFGIIGYGKLGGKELHYTSDLDVIFLHNSKGNQQLTDGAKAIDNAQFFVRLAQKITQTISLMTSSGRIYEIDARLRPNGASGFLVSSMDAFHQYQCEKAWVWEHQALVRARYVAGNDVLDDKFKEIKYRVLTTIKSRENLSTSVENMRYKMFQSYKSKNSFDLKQSRGGMIDIEFMVQYLVLLNANKLSSLCEYSANIPLLKYLHQNDCLSDEYLPLVDIYENWHKRLHQQILLQALKLELDDDMKKNISVVEHLWQYCFEMQKCEN